MGFGMEKRDYVDWIGRHSAMIPIAVVTRFVLFTIAQLAMLLSKFLVSLRMILWSHTDTWPSIEGTIYFPPQVFNRPLESQPSEDDTQNVYHRYQKGIRSKAATVS